MDHGYCVSYIVVFVEQQSWVEKPFIGSIKAWKKSLNMSKLKRRLRSVDIEIDLIYSHTFFRSLFQSRQRKICFKSVLGIHWHQQWLQSSYLGLSHLHFNFQNALLCTQMIYMPKESRKLPLCKTSLQHPASLPLWWSTCSQHRYDEAEDCERDIITILYSVINFAFSYASCPKWVYCRW